MINFIRDILKDPAEYSAVLLMVGVLFLLWVALCASGWIAVRTGNPTRRLLCALPALIFGLIGAWAQIPFSAESPSFHISFDFRWLFLAPLLLGVMGIVLYWRTRKLPVA